MSEYDDGSTYCFSANHTGRKDTQPKQEADLDTITMEGVAQLPLAPLTKRGINGGVASAYGVRVEYDGDGHDDCYYFPLWKDGKLIGYQAKRAKAPGTRTSKDVWRVGESKGAEPFGAHLIGKTGKFVLVTEGAEDALSAKQLLEQAGKNYRVVATLGTDGWKRMLDFFGGFEHVYIAYDQDEPGRKAASEFCAALKPGQGYVMQWDEALSDPNALLAHGKAKEFLDSIAKARNIRPDGIVSMADECERVLQEREGDSIPYPWAALNLPTYGMRQGELITWTAGTGVGKSAVIRELEYHLLTTTKDNIGILALEEDVRRTAWGLVGVHANRPLHIKQERLLLPLDDRRKLYHKVFGGNRVHCYDHFGSTAVENLLNKVRYLILGLNCRWVFLDHLSIIVSSQEGGDERRDIDRIMTMLRTIVQETGAGLHLVSHLKRVSGTGHEEGAAVSLNDLRGSQAIAQLSDGVIGLERNGQHEDPVIANQTILRVLKNRYAGITGKAGVLQYDRATGRLHEVEDG